MIRLSATWRVYFDYGCSLGRDVHVHEVAVQVDAPRHGPHALGQHLRRAAVEARTAQEERVLEVNAQPARMDLGDMHCRLARDLGVRVAISSDSHRESDLDLIRFGVDQARRGWLGPEQVINTRSLPGLRRLLRRS